MALKEEHQVFNHSPRKHILLITNHGCHAPAVRVTVDTGGQNIYINHLSRALIRSGYKITIINRGGFPHPVTGEKQAGITYYHQVWGETGAYCRIIYLEDGIDQFIPKEKLTVNNLEKEKDFFFEVAPEIEFNLEDIYFISSHYWDGGILGILLTEEMKRKGISVPAHVWTPHSLGILKKERYRDAPRETIESFRFPYRIAQEEKCIAQTDGVVSTSREIGKTLKKYKSQPKHIFWLPPAVDTELFYPREVDQCPLGIEVLKETLGRTKEETYQLVQERVVFLEISRTAKTKQKELVLTAFSQIKNREQALLIMNIDPNSPLHPEIMKTYENLPYSDNIVLIDRFLAEEEVVELFSLADVFVTASQMEGWGMAVQEGAASRCAIISSPYVPFVTEVLKEKAIVVENNSPASYREKIDLLIEQPQLREELAEAAYQMLTTKYSWLNLSQEFILEMKRANLID